MLHKLRTVTEVQLGKTSTFDYKAIECLLSDSISAN